MSFPSALALRAAAGIAATATALAVMTATAAAAPPQRGAPHPAFRAAPQRQFQAAPQRRQFQAAPQRRQFQAAPQHRQFQAAPQRQFHARPGKAPGQGTPGAAQRNLRPNFTRPAGTPGGLHAGPRLRNFSARPGAARTGTRLSVGGRLFPLIRERRAFWSGGRRRFFVPLASLGIAAIAGSYWYPDAFVAINGPACTGITPDGCRLQWRDVDFEDGGDAPQCVQYCPQSGPPPAQVAELPPPPPLTQDGACQLTVFAEPEFGGQSEPTSENAPSLGESGWQDAIASIKVQSGTWDFFTGENFGGDALRLPAGSYPTLAPEWSGKIGSFMCVEPGAPN